MRMIQQKRKKELAVKKEITLHTVLWVISENGPKSC